MANFPNLLVPCDECGDEFHYDELVETDSGKMLCEACADADGSAEADRRLDEWRDRLAEEGFDAIPDGARFGVVPDSLPETEG